MPLHRDRDLLYPAFMRHLLLLLALHSVLFAQETPRIDRIGTFYNEHDGFSGTITVAHGDNILFSKGYGLADRSSHIPTAPDSRFNIGSVSKQFTAAAILLLQQDGKLHTANPLGQYLASIPDVWKPITLRQLLSHTSGIPDYAGTLPDALKFNDHPALDLLAPLLAQPLIVKPGSAFDYSNTNYLLLALVVEHVSGQPFCDFLSTRILVPQGLTHTTCVSHVQIIPQHAIGYLNSVAGPVAAPPVVLSAYLGAANLVSTGPDLVRWTRALETGHILNAQSLKEMTTPVRNNYGYGLNLEPDDGHARLSHLGAVPGFDALLEYFPQTQTTMVVLSNLGAEGSDGHSTGTFAVDEDLDNLVNDPKSILLCEGKEATIPIPTLDQYLGRYIAPDTGKDLTQQATLTVRREGAHLIAILQQGDRVQPEFQLRAKTATVFYLAGDETEIEFDPKDSGHLTLTILRSPSVTHFDRIPPAAAKPTPE
jgi:CubicO group peptidase (beta-lactamase class C family)